MRQTWVLDGFEERAASLSVWPPEGAGLDKVWQERVSDFFNSPDGQSLSQRMHMGLAQGQIIYPPQPFRALELTPLASVRAVILGQDPYHGPGQAEGLAFSVAPGVKIPPSLRNIFQELQASLGLPAPGHGSLERWARQGVLLLNTCLTVEEGLPASHSHWGWASLTDALVAEVARSIQPVVFMLWGAHAQAKKALIDAQDPAGRHLLLLANHPSPLSAKRGPLPFLGCGHFAQANDFWFKRGEKPVNW